MPPKWNVEGFVEFDEDAVANVEHRLAADLLDPALPLNLDDQEQVLVLVAPNVILVAANPLEIVGDVSEVHAADINARSRAKYEAGALVSDRAEVSANRLQVVGPTLIGLGRPIPPDEFLAIQEFHEPSRSHDTAVDYLSQASC